MRKIREWLNRYDWEVVTKIKDMIMAYTSLAIIIWLIWQILYKLFLEF